MFRTQARTTRWEFREKVPGSLYGNQDGEPAGRPERERHLLLDPCVVTTLVAPTTGGVVYDKSDKGKTASSLPLPLLDTARSVDEVPGVEKSEEYQTGPQEYLP